MIATSILSADFANLQAEIQKVTEAGADWVHIDVMDGHFVPNITIGAPVVSSLKKISPLPLDVHLMITHPERYAEDFLKAGADYLTFHIEATQNPTELISLIKEKGGRPGITLRPSTPLNKIKDYLHMVDLVLVMTVEPGFGGQTFMEDQVDKIDELNLLRLKNAYPYLIEVDGGVNDKTFELCKNADVLVAGNYIFKSVSYLDRIQSLKQSRI